MTKRIKIEGFRYNDLTRKINKENFNVIVTVDSVGKSISINDEVISYHIPLEPVLKLIQECESNA